MSRDSATTLKCLGTLLVILAALEAVATVAFAFYEADRFIRGAPVPVAWFNWTTGLAIVGALASALGGIWLRELASRKRGRAFPVTPSETGGAGGR